jgi:hypothetical protein
MTLAEFLLARIAEDEEDVRASNCSGGPEWWMPDMWTRERALAECDAKRRIVEYAAGPWQLTNLTLDVALRLLALPYAKHADYREGWRP